MDNIPKENASSQILNNLFFTPFQGSFNLSDILSQIFVTNKEGNYIGRIKSFNCVYLFYSQLIIENNLNELYSCLTTLHNIFLKNPHIIITIIPINKEKLIYNTFVTCYINLNLQKSNELIINIKNKLLDILRIITRFVDCPIEIFEDVYQKIASFTLKKNASLNTSNSDSKTNIFIGYCDLLYALYDLREVPNIPLKHMPDNYIINNGAGVTVETKSNEMLFSNGITIMGWLNISEFVSDNESQKRLIIITTKEKTVIEIYLSTSMDKLTFDYILNKGFKKTTISRQQTNRTLIKSSWSFFNLTLKKEEIYKLTLEITNYNHLTKPIIQKISLDLSIINQEAISQIKFYENLECTFTSIIIGYNIDLEKIIKENSKKFVWFGVHNEKTLKLLLKDYSIQNAKYHVILTPYKTIVNNETMYIQLEDSLQNVNAFIHEICPHIITENMKYFENNTHSNSHCSSRINYIGGINALLPLLEIITTQKDIEMSNDLFEKIFIMILKLLTRSKYNFINAIISDFFPALSVLLENIPKKYYSPKICEYILNIKNFYIQNIQFFDNYFNGKIKRYNVFLEYIFFNEKILFRFQNHLIHLFWEQIKEMLNGVLDYHNKLPQLKETQETSATNLKDKSKIVNQTPKNQKNIVKELEYAHINYILTFDKFFSILIYFESKTISKHCCERHSKVIYKKKHCQQEGFLQLSLIKRLEPIENIICTLMQIESLFQKKDLLQLFKLIPLELSPCLKLFLIRIIPLLTDCSKLSNSTSLIQSIKELNLMTYLTISLGESLLTEKITILKTIIAVDKDNYSELFSNKKDICPLIKDIIPNTFKDNENVFPKITTSLFSQKIDFKSKFYEEYLKLNESTTITFYDFPQWVNYYYPKHPIIDDDIFIFDLQKIYSILFEWLEFWIKKTKTIRNNTPTSPDLEKFILKKNCLIELVLNYVIRTKHIKIFIEIFNSIEKLLKIPNEEGRISYINEFTGSHFFWLFIFEIYYFCFRIQKLKMQNTLIGEDTWFAKETPIENVNKFLNYISSKCNQIIQEMATCILRKGNNNINLYYILTWGTYHKILHQSVKKGTPYNDEKIILLSQFMNNILETYVNVIKQHVYQSGEKNVMLTLFIMTVLNIIYDFVLIFPIGTKIILCPNDTIEYDKKVQFYLPKFFVEQSSRVKTFSDLFEDVIKIILDVCKIQSIFSNDNYLELIESTFEQKKNILDNIVELNIYNKSYYDSYYNKLIFLTKCEKFHANDNNKLTYLSFPIIKNVMHFICSLTLIDEEKGVNHIKYLELLLINIITMTSCQNNKKSKNYSSPILKEINKIIEQVILLGFIFLFSQYHQSKAKHQEQFKSVVYFIKKILTNKNVSSITQSPLYNIFFNILQDKNKQSFISILKQDQSSSLNENIRNFFNKENLNYFIHENTLIFEIISDYFGKKETINHYVRIHYAIKQIIPIIKNVNPSDIENKSDGNIFKVETNNNFAVCDKFMNRNRMWDIEKMKIIREIYDLLEKLNRNTRLLCQQNKKVYKNIKKELFSWRGIWSDKNTFYYHPEKLKQKLLYHLTKEFSTPLLTPILDFDIYLPTFKCFNKNDLFLEDINEVSNYGVSLDIDLMLSLMKSKDKNNSVCGSIKNKHISQIISFLAKKYSQSTFAEKEQRKACMIKQTHHLPGIISLENNIITFEFVYNEEGTGIEETNLLYDTDNKTCYGSFFKNYKKDKMKGYIKIPLNKINMIFKRKYYYSNNSLEIFTDNNKSYCFHFRNHSQRKKFFDEIKNNQEFKVILRNSNKKDIYELVYISKQYQNKFGFKGASFVDYVKYWVTTKISNFEFLMFCNLMAGRSLRDMTQYPIFPWTLINYTSNKLKFIFSNFRPFTSPMGMLDISPEAKQRREAFIKEYKQMDVEEKLGHKKHQIEGDEEEETGETNTLKTTKNEKNLNFEDFLNVPYFYGTHFSNPLYVSHYLTRIFPFTQLRIELQGDNIDPTRVFSSILKTFISATTVKTDVRELIPEFFTLPEMFQNINKINLGISNTEVELPEWSKNKTYLFVKEMRKSLEYQEEIYDNGIHRWLDLIIGNLRRGRNAINIGNIYMYHTYTSVFQIDKFKSREEISKDNLIWLDYYLRLSELGICPQYLISEELPAKYNKMSKSIVLSKDLEIKEIKVKKLTEFFENEFIYLHSQTKDFQIYAVSNQNEFFYFYTNLISSEEDKKITKETFFQNKLPPYLNSIKQLPSFKKFHKYPILINPFTIIQGGFWDGSLVCYNRPNNTVTIKTNDYDKSVITVLAFDKSECFVFCGTQKGSVIIYFLQYIQQKSEGTAAENKKFQIKKKNPITTEELLFKTCLSHHSDEITAITVSDILNIVGTTAQDGYVNIYISPSFKLVRSVKLTIIPYSDYLFISNTPVPCFVLVHKNQFESYTINGSIIEVEKTIKDKSEKKNEIEIFGNYDITSYFFFTDLITYIQYIMIGTSNGFIHIREFPEMKLYSYIKVYENCSIDALISIDTTNNDFLIYSKSAKANPNFKIIHNPKATSESLVSCL